MKNWPKKWIAIAAIVLIIVLLSGQVAKAANTVSPNLGLGIQRKSFLGQDDAPRGIRNNNPGNLRLTDPPQNWMGSIELAENTDGEFEQFVYYIYGVRAMTKLLRNKINAGQNTVRKLIYAYAPPGENDTEAFIANVEGWTGLQQNLPVRAADKDKLFLIAQAIERQENGIQVMSRQDFDAGWTMI